MTQGIIPKARWPFRAVLFAVALIGIVGPMIWWAAKGAKRTRVAIGFLNGCPAAVEILGEPVRVSLWSNYSWLSGTGQGVYGETYAVPLRGARAMGIYSFVIPQEHGEWERPLDARLSVGSKDIDIAACVLNEELRKMKRLKSN